MSWFVHITVNCPTCRSRYQVEPSLQGHPMRCPNPVCREIFVVEDKNVESPPPEQSGGKAPIRPFKLEPFGDEPTEVERRPVPPEKNKAAGSVGDLVPILDAEVVDEVPAEPSSRKNRSKHPQTDKVPAVKQTQRMPAIDAPTAEQPDAPPTAASWRPASCPMATTSAMAST